MGHARGDEQAAIATTTNGKSCGLCITVVYEPLCGGDKIIEDILFVELGPRLVPCLAVFPTTTQTGLGMGV